MRLWAARLISPRLHEDVEHLALGIDGAPEIHSLAANRDEHLVQMPIRIGLTPHGPKASRIARTEGDDPPPNRLVGHNDPDARRAAPRHRGSST